MSSEGDVIKAYSEPLPEGWSSATLPELTRGGVFSDGDWVESKDQDKNGDVRLIQLADIGVDNFKDNSDKYLTAEKAEELNCTFLQEGDILIARMPDPLGRATIFPGREYPCVTVVDVCIVRPGNPVDNNWLMHIINSPSVREVINDLQSGTTRKRISRKNLAKIEIPIPPIGEQNRIVQKIDELFSKLDSGLAELEQANTRLQNYKKVVLNRALEGNLTADIPIEEKIKSELRDGDPRPDLPSNAPELSPNWEWVRFETVLSETLRNGKSAKKAEEGIRTLTLTAVTERDFSEKNTKITEANPEDVEDLWLESGDLLIERSNTEKYVGLPAVYRGEEDYAIYPDLMIRARFRDSLILPEFADYILLSPFYRNYLRKKSKGTSGSMAKINQKHLRNMPFPLSPIEEQRLIVERLDQIISVVDQSLLNVSTEKERSHRLRQSILKYAFEGRLVPQDSADESAEVSIELGDENHELGEQKTLSEVTTDVE